MILDVYYILKEEKGKIAQNTLSEFFPSLLQLYSVIHTGLIHISKSERFVVAGAGGEMSNTFMISFFGQYFVETPGVTRHFLIRKKALQFLPKQPVAEEAKFNTFRYLHINDNDSKTQK